MSNILLGILLISTAVVILIELVLGGYVLFIHLLPFSVRYLFYGQYSHLWVSFVYLLIILINVISISVLLLGLLSGYFEKWFSYEVIGLVSLSLIIYLTAHKYQTGIDLFEQVIIKEVYYDHMKSYDPNHNCHFRSQCFEAANFHRIKKCCGWDRPEDYFESDWNLEHNDQIFLPKYCCSFWYIKYTQNNCTIDSNNRFVEGCRSAMIDEYQTFNPISYRYGVVYPIVKTISLVSFKIAKMFSLLPRAEGIFSHSIPK